MLFAEPQRSLFVFPHPTMYQKQYPKSYGYVDIAGNYLLEYQSVTMKVEVQQ